MLAVVLVIYFEPFGPDAALNYYADPIGTIIYAVLSMGLAFMQFREPIFILMQGVVWIYTTVSKKTLVS